MKKIIPEISVSFDIGNLLELALDAAAEMPQFKSKSIYASSLWDETDSGIPIFLGVRVTDSKPKSRKT